MRIGTWNVANRQLSKKHKTLLTDQGCDIWLLTEINPDWIGGDDKILGFHCHRSKGFMEPKQYWAAVLSDKPFDQKLNDPHPASAAVVLNKITYCSSVLPWRTVKESAFPPNDSKHCKKTELAIEILLKKLPTSNLVWGGDWNHSLIGSEGAGSFDGREYLLDAIKIFRLQVPTTDLLHQNARSKTIDHIAVPKNWIATGAKQIDAKGLSDHDAYVVDVQGSTE